MRYSITSLSWEKYVFHREKWNFEHVATPAHTAEYLALRNALNIYIDNFMFYPSLQNVK